MADGKRTTTADPTISSGSGTSPSESTSSEAPKVSDADDAGQAGEIRELPDDRKPDPSTIAQEQVLPERGYGVGDSQIDREGS